MTDLATEEARAMSGRPAWRVAAACIKGVACPRCKAVQGVRCNAFGRPSCRERVWRQRAKERATKAYLSNGSVSFWMAVCACHPTGIAEGHGAPETGLDWAIDFGVARLSLVGGAPRWVLTEAAVSLFAEVEAAMNEQTTPEAPPYSPPVDAAAATQAFLERGKP